MSALVAAHSGGEILHATLDFETRRWSSSAPNPPEGAFPFVAELDGRRYELYSDATFDEVESASR